MYQATLKTREKTGNKILENAEKKKTGISPPDYF